MACDKVKNRAYLGQSKKIFLSYVTHMILIAASLHFRLTQALRLGFYILSSSLRNGSVSTRDLVMRSFGPLGPLRRPHA